MIGQGQPAYIACRGAAKEALSDKTCTIAAAAKIVKHAIINLMFFVQQQLFIASFRGSDYKFHPEHTVYVHKSSKLLGGNILANL